MAGISPTGFTKKTLEEILVEVKDAIHSKVDATLDLSPDQPIGQIVEIVCQREAVLWELLETLAHAMDPDEAEGFLADFLANLTGTFREAATKSTVTVNCNANNGFTAAAGAIQINVTGNPTTKFVNKSAVGPLTPAGVYPVVFESLEYGPIVANAATLTTISPTVSGLNSVTNPLDATLGTLRETDTALMTRRADEITAQGASTVDAIRSDVLAVPGVLQAYVFENQTLSTNVDGLPGKSFETVVYDGVIPAASNAAIGRVIWDSKPPGAETIGSTSVNVLDSTGVLRPVKFSRATVVQIWLDLPDVSINTEKFPANGATLIKDAIVAYALEHQNLGVDVVSLGCKAAALTVPGVLDVPTLRLGVAPAPVATANIVITGRQIASLDTSRISVATVAGTP